MDISKQYHMVLNQHALSQCILHGDHPNDPLDVYIHNGLIMGHIYSSSLVGYCMIQTGKLFDDLLDKARAQTLDYDKIYAPLSYALREGILKPPSLPTSFSLEKLIRDSLYADNLIICKDSSSDLVKRLLRWFCLWIAILSKFTNCSLIQFQSYHLLTSLNKSGEDSVCHPSSGP